MTARFPIPTVAAAALLAVMLAPAPGSVAMAQEQAAAAATTSTEPAAPEPLSADEMEVLVARIALYPDELVAVITAASLYPLQIVEAARFLDARKKDKDLKPKDSWDGSVISLLNYPEVVKMMSDDLEWTQSLGDAIAYQQKDVLVAIQQLRDEAVAKGIIKTDDKMKVTNEGDNVVIQSAAPNTVYVPRYEPEMLYVDNYAPAPVTYYPEPYPDYWYPTATFFAAAVTGAAWAAAVDWDDWGVWGGRWNGGDIDVDCNKCFNNIDVDRKMNFNDVDWRNVDRSKINVDRSQFAKLDRTNIKNNVTARGENSLKTRASDIKKRSAAANPARAAKVKDVRKSTLEGLKKPGGPAAGQARPAAKQAAAARRDGARPSAGNANRPTKVNRPSGKPKAGGRVDNRPRKPSGLGNVDRGRTTQLHSSRGRQSMGGGHRGGGRAMRGGGGGGRHMRGGGGGRRR